MTDELDKRFSHGLSDDRVWSKDVPDGEHRKQYSDAHNLERLQHHVLPAESWQTFVPYGCKQLLDIRMCNEL